jgi:hypothetical protein
LGDPLRSGLNAKGVPDDYTGPSKAPVDKDDWERALNGPLAGLN